MRKIVAVGVLACFAMLVSVGQEKATMKQELKQAVAKDSGKSEGKWHGYIVDAMCAKGILKKDNIMERAAKHTKDCALEESCASSGFGLFYDNRYYKFDEAGDKMAKAAIEKSAREKGLMFDVNGTMDGDKIIVASLDEMKMDSKEMDKKSDEMKKSEKQPAHKH